MTKKRAYFCNENVTYSSRLLTALVDIHFRRKHLFHVVTFIMASVTFRRANRRMSLVNAENGENGMDRLGVPGLPSIVVRSDDATENVMVTISEEAEGTIKKDQCSWETTRDSRLEMIFGGVLVASGSGLIVLQVAVSLYGGLHPPLLQNPLHQAFQGAWNGILLLLAGSMVLLHGWQRTSCPPPSTLSHSQDITRLERLIQRLHNSPPLTALGRLVTRCHHGLHQHSYRVPEIAMITCTAAILSGLVGMFLSGFAYARFPPLISLKGNEPAPVIPNVTFPESDSAVRQRLRGSHWHHERTTLLALQAFIAFLTLLGLLISTIAVTVVYTFWEATPGVQPKKKKPPPPKPEMVTVGTDSQGLEDDSPFEQWMAEIKADDTEHPGPSELLQAIPQRIRKISRSISTYLNEAIQKPEAGGSRRVSRIDAGC